jgi:hypothetical protein
MFCLADVEVVRLDCGRTILRVGGHYFDRNGLEQFRQLMDDVVPLIVAAEDLCTEDKFYNYGD